MSIFNISPSPIKLPFVLGPNGLEGGTPARGWLQWLSAVGDGLSGIWGQNPLSIVQAGGGGTATGGAIYLGRAVSVNVQIIGASITPPTAISGLPEAVEKSILSVVLLDGSGNATQATAIIAAGATSATLYNAGGTANEILVSGIYRTR